MAVTLPGGGCTQERAKPNAHPKLDFDRDRLQLDVARIFKASVGERTWQFRPELAAYNPVNADPVLSQLTVFRATLGNVSSILNPRVVRPGVTEQF
jgi:hypothetical protein